MRCSDLKKRSASICEHEKEGGIYMSYGIVSIIPPLVALILAFKTKKANMALIVGIFLGSLILSDWNPILGVVLMVNTIIDACTNPGNFKTVLFTCLMGAFVYMLRVSGGVAGFIDYLVVENTKILNLRKSLAFS
jgi:hypothetical protein